MGFALHCVNYLGSLLAQIPGTFWGVVAGSFFSLTGVILSNRNSARNLAAQFDNERRTRAMEREMTLRKEIYLAAAEAIAVGFATLGRFVDLKKEGDTLTAQYLERSPAIAKIYIVANIDTLTKIVDVQSALAAAFMHMHVDRIPGLKAQRDLAIAMKETDNALGRQSQTLDLIRAENQNGRPDQSKWNALQSHFKIESDLVNASLQKQGPLEQTVGAVLLQLAESSRKQTVHLSSMLAPAIAAIRRELALPIDETLLQDLTTRLVKKVDEKLGELIVQIRASMKLPPSPVAPPPPKAA